MTTLTNIPTQNVQKRKIHIAEGVYTSATLILSLIFAILAYSITPPEQYDLYRHYLHIGNLKNLSFNQVVEAARPGYLTFDVYAWFVSNAGLSKNFFTASIVFSGYILIFSVLKDILYKNEFRSRVTISVFILSFLIFWQSINFVMLSSGIRGVFSSIIVFYAGYYFIEHGKKYKFFILSIFALSIHPFALAMSLLFLLSKVFKRFSAYSRLIVLFGLFVLLTQGSVVYVLSLLDMAMSGFSFYKPSYLSLDAKWGAGYVETRNINGIVGTYIISNLPLYVLISYLLISKPIKNSTLNMLLSLMVAYFCFFFMFYTIFERMHYIMCFISGWLFVSNYLKRKSLLNKLFVVLYLVALLVFSVYSIYVYKAYLLS